MSVHPYFIFFLNSAQHSYSFTAGTPHPDEIDFSIKEAKLHDEVGNKFVQYATGLFNGTFKLFFHQFGRLTDDNIALEDGDEEETNVVDGNISEYDNDMVEDENNNSDNYNAGGDPSAVAGLSSSRENDVTEATRAKTPSYQLPMASNMEHVVAGASACHSPPRTPQMPSVAAMLARDASPVSDSPTERTPRKERQLEAEIPSGSQATTTIKGYVLGS